VVHWGRHHARPDQLDAPPIDHGVVGIRGDRHRPAEVMRHPYSHVEDGAANADGRVG
jgi:hypothetical protein